MTIGWWTIVWFEPVNQSEAVFLTFRGGVGWVFGGCQWICVHVGNELIYEIIWTLSTVLCTSPVWSVLLSALTTVRRPHNQIWYDKFNPMLRITVSISQGLMFFCLFKYHVVMVKSLWKCLRFRTTNGNYTLLPLWFHDVSTSFWIDVENLRSVVIMQSAGVCNTF